VSSDVVCLLVGWLLLTAFFFFLFIQFITTRPSTSTVLCLYLCFYCAVFQYSKGFNSDISKWNTENLQRTVESKSFTIECCVFCLCQVMLFVCLFVVVVDSVLLFFYLFNSLPHVHQPPLFCVCTSAFIVQCSMAIQPSIQTFQNGTWGASKIWLKVSLSQSSVVSFVCVK
jgi:surface protein